MIQGARLGITTNVLEQVISAFTTILLVRLLAPQDVGLVAAASVVLGLLGLVTQLGFPAAVLLVQPVTARFVTTMYWCAALAGLAVTAATWLFSSPLAAAVGQPGSAPLLIVLAFSLLFRITATVPRALLQRREDFGHMYGAQLLGVVAYPLTALPLAHAGFGAYSMVYGQVVAAVVALASYHVGARFWPRLSFDAAAVRRHLGLGATSLVLVGLTYIAKNADYWAVGRAGSAAALGVYYVAYVLPSLVRLRLTTLATELFFSTFKRLEHDAVGTRVTGARLLGTLSFVGFPALIGLIAVAPSLVSVVFGPRWDDAAAPMRILCLAAMADLVAQVSYTVMYARGEWHRVVTVQAVKVISLGLLLALAAQQPSLLLATSCAVAVSAAVGAAYSQWQLSRLGIGVPGTALLTPLLYSVPMLGVVLGLQALASEVLDPPALLLSGVSVGALVYVATAWCVLPATGRPHIRSIARLVNSGKAP